MVAGTIRWLAAHILMCCILLLGATAARAEIELLTYQVPIAPAPAFVSDAIATLPARRAAVVTTMACGQEFNFVARLTRDDQNGEGVSADVLGKMAWIILSGQQMAGIQFTAGPCEFTEIGLHWEVCKVFVEACWNATGAPREAAAKAFEADPAWQALVKWPDPGTYTPDVGPVRNKMLSILPAACRNGPDGAERYSIVATNVSDKRPAQVRLKFRVARECIAAQIDLALMKMTRGDRQVGTDGAPCHYTQKTKGDWDATLKDLIRIAEIDRQTPVLTAAARKHLNDDLIDVDGGPAAENYHFWECGNEEKSTGSPQERSDYRDSSESIADDVWGSGWDFLAFLAMLLLILILLILAAVLALISAVVAIIAGIVAALGVAAVVLALVLTVPETENHLWMINSTKYLNNQYIMANGGTGYGSDQVDLREWILEEMQAVMKSDFLEYNSRPYQRYSLVAIANLADFAHDPDIRVGARAVIEYAVAKYAVASSEGRRYAPYRRKRELMKIVDGMARDGKGGTAWNGLFDLEQGGDHQHAIGLFYFGVSLNLPQLDGNAYVASRPYASQAIYWATSGYRPDETVYSLVIDRQQAPLVHQRLHHHGWEIVSSGRSFTIAAGGLTTGMPKNVTFDALDGAFKDDDLGAAVPTTVMFAGPAHIPPTLTQAEVARPFDARRSTLERFLRFQGELPLTVDETPSYDLNLCVWDGFACGVNLLVPEDLKAPCMKSGHLPDWFLVRSDDPDCPAYNKGPPFWMSLFNKSHDGGELGDFGPVHSIGLVEVVDGGDMSFDDFKARVAARNPGTGGPFDLSDEECAGAYVSARGPAGQRIEFDCVRVTKVDSTGQLEDDDWPHAGAPPGALGHAPIQSNGNGKVEITSLAGKRKLTLNFEWWFDPRIDWVALP